MHIQQQSQRQPVSAHQQGGRAEPRQADTDGAEGLDEVMPAASRAGQQTGTDGPDRLLNTASGAWMAGGKGDDLYVVDDDTVVVHERPDEGSDTVRASVSFKLSRNVERLELTGGGDINGIGNVGHDRLIGNAGANTLTGSAGDDSIEGGAGDDRLHGDSGDDRLSGGPGDDYLDGGFGNDVLIGGSGSDTYVLRRSMGQDYVYDEDATPGNIDVIRARTALAPAEIEVMRDGDDLLLRVRRTTSGIRVGNWFKASRFRIEQLRFDDGTVWDAATLESRAESNPALPADLAFGREWGTGILHQQQARAQGVSDPSGQRKRYDNIFGYGAPAPDTIFMRRGAAGDMSLPAPLWTQCVDTIRIDAAIARADISLMRDHDDLILLAAGGEAGFLRVRRGFDRARIEFADGTVWDNATVRRRLQPKTRNDGGVFYGYDDSADVLDGLSSNDWMFGFDGDDILNGHDGRDSMYGGAGNDRMTGGLQGDIMHGGPGNDFLDGGRGSDYMDGGAGDDTLFGGRGDDTIDGGVGDDHIDGGTGDDILYGGQGCDLMRGGAGNDRLYGGPGKDTYYLDLCAGADSVDEGEVQDLDGNVIEVNAELRQSDIVLVRDGSDLQLGYRDMQSRLDLRNLFDGGPAYIETVNFADGSAWSFQELERRSIAASATASDDLLYGRGGARWWQGDPLAADIHDVLSGLDGADRLTGYAGNDLLDGGLGDDVISGGAGGDLLAGGMGRDRLLPGHQGDVIVFNRGDGNDTIAIDGVTSATAGSSATGLTLSLGGVRCNQLSLRKSGHDLMLDMGAGDSVSFENWYAAAPASGTQLQLVLDSSGDYQADAEELVRRRKVVVFDFDGMVAQYDRKRAEQPALDRWSLANALAQYRLRGSDTMAIGGELAYHYAHHGGWTQLRPPGIAATLVNASFGSGDQAIAGAGGALPGAG